MHGAPGGLPGDVGEQPVVDLDGVVAEFLGFGADGGGEIKYY